jgi:hypothetical protein
MASLTCTYIQNAREFLFDERCFATYLKQCPLDEVDVMLQEFLRWTIDWDTILTGKDFYVDKIMNVLRDLPPWFECSLKVADVFETYDVFYCEFYKPHVEKMFLLAEDSAMILRDFIQKHGVKVSRDDKKEKARLVSLAADVVLTTRPKYSTIGNHIKRKYTRLYHYWFHDDVVLLDKIYNEIKRKGYSKAKLLRICSSHSFSCPNKVSISVDDVESFLARENTN